MGRAALHLYRVKSRPPQDDDSQQHGSRTWVREALGQSPVRGAGFTAALLLPPGELNRAFVPAWRCWDARNPIESKTSRPVQGRRRMGCGTRASQCRRRTHWDRCFSWARVRLGAAQAYKLELVAWVS